MLAGSHCEVLWWDDAEEHRIAAHDADPFPPVPPELVRRARRVGEAQQMDDVAGIPCVPEGIRALRVVPVLAPGRPDVVACLAIWAPMPVGIEAGPQRPVHQAVRLASLAVVDHHSKVALQWEASHDALTGLENRAGFESDLARHHNGCALLYIDLDDFKPVNDEHGHHAGDAVLITVARRLEAATRAMDSVARIGGDEFAVLIPAPVDIDLATDIAARIIEAVARPISVAGHTIVVGASVGLAMDHGTLDSESLFKRADRALYDAKVGGKRQLAMSL
jgi:diguanylate cyclase (GGDEF)-like protein